MTWFFRDPERMPVSLSIASKTRRRTTQNKKQVRPLLVADLLNVQEIWVSVNPIPLDYGHPALNAFKNALTSKKFHCPSPVKSAIGS